MIISTNESGGAMSGTFTTSTARNIFYGGTVFCFLLFLALTYQNEQALPARANRANLTEQQLDDLAEFLKYSSQINTANWPPNIEG